MVTYHAPTSSCKIRSSNWPVLIAICLSLPLFFLRRQIGTDLLRNTSERENFGSDDVSSVQTLRSGDKVATAAVNSVSCPTVLQNFDTAFDTITRQMFKRYTDDEPRFWISLHAKDYDKVRWGIMDHGRYYEQSQSESFRKILASSSKPRVIDVGGNIGWYTLLSASMGGTVDVFEPNPRNFLRLCESVCLNRWVEDDLSCQNYLEIPPQSSSMAQGRIRIFDLGIGEEDSTALFDTGKQKGRNPGAGGIVVSKSVVSLDKYTRIHVMPLDVLAEKLGWYEEQIDIMKIDVEGYEVHVMRGAKQLLKARRVKNIFMEGDVSGPASQKRFREVIRILAGAGYSVFKIGGYSGPSDSDVPPMDDHIEITLTAKCNGPGKTRKKCNLWWKLSDT